LSILLLEDEPIYATMIMDYLGQNHSITHLTNGALGLTEFLKNTYDLILLDWEMPMMNGIEFLTKIRNELNRQEPVIMITSHQCEKDIVLALELGADDYLIKPVRLPVLKARILAVLRRNKHYAIELKEQVIESYAINHELRTISLHGEILNTTQKEYIIAKILLEHLGQAVSRHFLFEMAWSQEEETSSRTIDTHMARVRLKLRFKPENGFRLSSVYNFGYRLEKIEDINSEDFDQ
jgi:two-component system response regulator RegX3